MVSKGIAPTLCMLALVWIAGQPIASAATYEENVAKAEDLWRQGRKVDAVRLYGAVWRTNPNDIDRLILYGNRSREIRNWRWSINFFKVAETKAGGNPTHLYHINMGYAKTFRASGYANKAQPYEEKAAALRDSGKVSDTAPRTGTNLGFYTETPTRPATAAGGLRPPPRPIEPTPMAVAPSGVLPGAPPGGELRSPTDPAPVRPVRYLKKRIAVAPIGVAVGQAGVAAYGNQVHAMMITELRKTNRFIVVERENLEGILGEQDLAASGRIAKGSGPKTGRLLGAQLMTKAEITDFEQQSSQGRSVGVGPVGWGRGKSTIRVGMDLRIYDTETGVVIASENVAAEKVASERDVGVNVSGFRWSDRQSQNSTLGFVTRELVQKALAKILVHSDKIPWRASVIKASGDKVYINAGTLAGVRVGDRFTVASVGETLTDPDTGEVLATEEKEVGVLEVLKASEKFSICRAVQRTGEIKRLDKVVAR